ncbi:MAG: hypothetical protein MUC96_31595 [Myxococcaceae bacterium]|jgi:hypothetical protein|nr:hypothetical protein [Myxococcaceae bacterium]
MRLVAFGSVVIAALGCSAEAPPMQLVPMEPWAIAGGAAGSAGGSSGGGGAIAVDAGDPADRAPRAWAPVSTPVTHDVDGELLAVLEVPALRGACDAVKRGGADRATRLRCGKWMFFYETFGTIGVPVPLVDFLQKYYAGYYGVGFSRMGMVPDPTSTKNLPLGLAPTSGKVGTVSTYAFTCASCHFGRMPDGRYAVGYGNLSLEYGNLLASLGAPLQLSTNPNDMNVHPRLKAELAGPVAAARMQQGYQLDMGVTGLSLLGAGSSGALTVQDQERFLALRPGTMDFLTKPLVDDGVWTVSRILPLWNLPDATQRADAGMAHELLSWNGGTRSVDEFLAGFVAFGGSKETWTREQLLPLAEYLQSLRAPAPLAPIDAAEARVGARLFVTKGCLECHSGPSGESARTYTFDEMGTDAAYAAIYNPGPDGKPCCNFPGEASMVTRQVKAPRMSGLFSQTRFLHNGSVTLEELFCLSPRDPSRLEGQRSDGHGHSCEGLNASEKQALMTYLRSL